MEPLGERQASPGTVFLVGAGPGDPGLMTRRALELIAGADAILYDRLIPAGALDGARPDADLRHVGKRPGAPSLGQDEINALLIELARAGRRVVRLKGGDPFVFGRGGEEAQALRAAAVPFEVVPGVTSGVAAPAYAGVPVTHRDDASAVALVTAHEDPAKPESALDWEALAAFPGTLVLYMGVGRLEGSAERLVRAGRSPDEPAAVIERGSLPGQRTVTAPLAEIGKRVREAELRPPAITVIGAVARLREELAWFERRPLFGRVVAVTRARAQASELAARLRELGAEVVEAPAIRVAPRPPGEGDFADALAAIDEYALVCLTSPNGAELLLDGLAATGRDARSLAGAGVAAIGPGTARALAARGVRADVVPERSIAEALVEALADVPVEGRRVLVPRAAEARDVLPDALRERGARVDVVPLYDTVPEPLSPAALEGLERADYVTFTASSTVTSMLAALESAAAPFPAGARIASIGPVTSATAHARGLDVAVEAQRHDVDGLVEALVADVCAGADARTGAAAPSAAAAARGEGPAVPPNSP
jgi:uroporphyrinogen III methyltransferase/synthase